MLHHSRQPGGAEHYRDGSGRGAIRDLPRIGVCDVVDGRKRQLPHRSRSWHGAELLFCIHHLWPGRHGWLRLYGARGAGSSRGRGRPLYASVGVAVAGTVDRVDPRSLEVEHGCRDRPPHRAYGSSLGRYRCRDPRHLHRARRPQQLGGASNALRPHGDVGADGVTCSCGTRCGDSRIDGGRGAHRSERVPGDHRAPRFHGRRLFRRGLPGVCFASARSSPWSS